MSRPSHGFYNRPTSLVMAALMLVTSLSSPSGAQQPPADVTLQARAVLTAIGANEFAKVEDQFTLEMNGARRPAGGAWSALVTCSASFQALRRG